MNAAEKTVTTDNKYAALEQEILKVVGAGKNRQSAICAEPGIQKESMPFTQGLKPVHRIIEGRMKVLRQRGLLKYDSKEGWKVLNV
jgi:hypothetical protein